MSQIFNFCAIYAIPALAILMTIVSIVLLIALNWQGIKAELYKLMLQAKRLAKDEILKSGDEQIEWIVMAANIMMPRAWRIFLSEDRLRVIIKYLYGKLKKCMEQVDKGRDG